MDAACALEIRAYCALEADIVLLLESAAARDEKKLHQRRQRVRDCLVDNADELSPPCVAALVGNAATRQSAPPADGAGEALTTDTANTENGPVPAVEQTSAPLRVVPAEQPVAAPPRQQVLAPAPVVQLQPQYVQAATDGDGGVEVRIFLINHPGGQAGAAAAPATPYIRIGGDATQHIDSGDQATKASGMVMSAWVWVAILPFLCIGIYVSVVQTIAFVRRRRDVVYRVGAAQYMPIPSSLSSSKPLQRTTSSST